MIDTRSSDVATSQLQAAACVTDHGRSLSPFIRLEQDYSQEKTEIHHP